MRKSVASSLIILLISLFFFSSTYFTSSVKAEIAEASAQTGDSWLLTFTYRHSTRQMAIDLDPNIIPEFPSAIILPLFIIFTFVAVVITKKIRCRKA